MNDGAAIARGIDGGSTGLTRLSPDFYMSLVRLKYRFK